MIVFSSVSKSFGDNKTAIDNFSFEVKDGDLVVITGPSGAGKTTLMKLMIKEYDPSEGEITFEGKKINELKDSEIPELRRKIAVVFQDYKLIQDLNVWENIALPMNIAGKTQKEIEERVTDLLNLVELADKALYFPNQLSGGEAQRISIARALATSPKIIFADEPTGNLDSEASLRITRLLKKINQLGTTLLFATHDDLVLKELAKEKTIELRKKIQEVKENIEDGIEEIKDIIEETVEEIKEEVKEEKKDNEAEKVEEKIHKAEEISFKNRNKKKLKLPKIGKIKGMLHKIKIEEETEEKTPETTENKEEMKKEEKKTDNEKKETKKKDKKTDKEKTKKDKKK